MIESKLYSLEQIVAQIPAWRFTVPIYQRLYVWGEDQVQTLLNDLVNAYERDEDLFFLGGALVVEQKDDHGIHYELIDGQQRFTTLWMLCYVWQRALMPFLTIKEGEQIFPRIRFAIRPQVNEFLEALAFDGKEITPEHSHATESMEEAVATMCSLFQKRSLPSGVDRETYLLGLSRFAFSRVKLVLTKVPQETDLNKLFEVINNRGVQLQHHEILKARMLDALSEVERRPYAILWEACADMSNFVERSLVGNSYLSAKAVAALYDRTAAELDAEPLTKAVSVLKKLEQNQLAVGDAQALTLETILDTESMPDEESDGDETVADDTSSWMRSIMGFPMLLQHTLRIWLYHQKLQDMPRILDRELLELFEQHFFKDCDEASKAQRVRTFIQLLWEIRYLLDKHIIKWVDQGEDKVHLISRIITSESRGALYLSRDRESDAQRGFSLLQSMLYHSQEITTQYWLTPLLHHMHTYPGEVDGHYHYLRHLETYLLGSEAEGSLSERTRAFMEQPWRTYPLNHRSELQKGQGVNFRHYWFYKLEFVLWYLQKGGNEKWYKFRFTAKNSVEHISPQNPVKQDDNRVEVMLDHFGNLALVSRSMNSEYSNLPFNEKRQRFINNNKEKVDSLKMDLIYQNTQWNDELARRHQDEMIRYLDKYTEKL